MPKEQSAVVDTNTAIVPRYEYKTINELSQVIQPTGAKWCLYGIVKFRREINFNCMLLGICDPTSYGKGPKGASCLLYRESFAGLIELPVHIEVGQIIRLHRMKITNYRPENGCMQMKSSNYYSWLIFNGKDDTSHQPIAQSSLSYSFSDTDCQKIDELRAWLLSFGDNETLYNELDFQFVLPTPKSFIDQSIQTNDENLSDSGTTTIINIKDQGESSEFFSASDEDESARKKFHAD